MAHNSKMKTTLLFVLVALVASTNATFSVNSCGSHHLWHNFGPTCAPIAPLCDNCNPVPRHKKAEEVAKLCTSNQKEIAPLFDKPEGEEFKNLDCICLKEYVCCPNPCPVLETKRKLCDSIAGCKQLTNYIGYYCFGNVSDCCGCYLRHITTCSKPRPVVCTTCETFVEHHHLNELGCWESGCQVTPHPIYPPVDCDLRCQYKTTVKVECGYDKPACLGNRIEDCHPEKPEHNKCKEEPTKTLKNKYSVGTKDITCSQCSSWSHVTKPTTIVPIDCDDHCETKERIVDLCGNIEEKCSSNNPHEPCHPAKPAEDVCREPWQKKNTEEWNFSHTTRSCKQCYEWKAKLKTIVKKTAECNVKCFKTVREDDECGGWEEHCEDNNCERAECRPEQPAEKPCYEPAEKNPDTGVYCVNGDGCEQCWDWKEPVKIPCASVVDTCHRFEEDLPDMCFEMIDVKGECCGSKSCTQKEEQCVQKFASQEVEETCPAGSVLIIGTSTCGTTRHLCYPCPQFKAVVVCDKKCHDLEKVNNLFDCEEQRCVKRICPSLEMPACDDDRLEMAANECSCPIIKCGHH